MILRIILLGLVGINSISGLRCYACIGTTVYDPCVLDNGVPIGCDGKYCTIFRREFHHPPGTIANFIRQCQNAPGYLNAEVNDTDFRTFYYACSTDLCNSGEGRLKPLTIGPIKDEPGKVMIVHGIETSMSTVSNCYFIIVCALVSLPLLLM